MSNVHTLQMLKGQFTRLPCCRILLLMSSCEHHSLIPQERSDALTVLAVAFYEFVAYVALNYYLIDPAESDLLIKLFQIFK